MSIDDFDLIASVHHSVTGLNRSSEICCCSMLHVPAMFEVGCTFNMLKLNLEEFPLVEWLDDKLWATLSPLLLSYAASEFEVHYFLQLLIVEVICKVESIFYRKVSLVRCDCLKLGFVTILMVIVW